MENTIYDKKNGLWYERQGDYFLPCLELPKQEERSIGVWGRRLLRYLKEYRMVTYTNLLTSGKLNSYLADIEEQAEKMFPRLIKEMAEKQGLTETLKAEQPMEWVEKMGNIQSCAREVVDGELIFV